MTRLYWTGAALAALLLAFVGGIFFIQHAENAAFNRGFVAGSASVELRVNSEVQRRKAASDEALALSNRKIAELEMEHDRLQHVQNTLEHIMGRDDHNDRRCLDAGIVRTLNAIDSTSPDRPHP